MPSPIQFGTEQFTAATTRAEGIPDHAAMIEGRLIHLDTKTLKGWGITAKASDQIIASIPGIPIRACNSPDPHACDDSFDDASRVGYATRAWIDGEWVMAAAAITDKNAAKNIDDGTWTPFGKGGWSVVGFPDGSQDTFRESGFMDGFRPAGVSLVLASTATPAYIGSGFEMVAAAISNYRGNNMTETPEGGDNPKTYTQEQFDAAVKTALAKQKTDDAAVLKEAADAEIAKQKEASIAELTKQKAEFEDKIKKLSDSEKAAYEAKIADMTSKDDMKATLEAHGKKVQADTLDALKRQEYLTEYSGIIRKDATQKVPVVSAPFIKDGVFSDELFNTELETLGGMVTAGIAGIVDKTKMVAAAVPGQNSFNEMQIPGTPPGSEPEGIDQKALDAMGIPSIEFV